MKPNRAEINLNVKTNESPFFYFFFNPTISVLLQSAFHKLLFCVTVSKAYAELNLFQKKHDVNPLRGFLVPLMQVSLSLYFFFFLI